MAGAGVAAGKKTAARQRAWIVFEDESGVCLRPSARRTWAPVGATPVVEVVGKGSRRRASMAGWCCYRAGHLPRLVWMARGEQGYGGEDFPDLLRALHRRLGTPIVLIWDNLTGHVRSGKVTKFIVDNADWLTVYQLPGYAPELNPVEGLWSVVKNSLANLAARSMDELITAVRHDLRQAEIRPGMLTALLTGAGLAWE